MTQVGDPLHTENHMTNFIRTGNRAANQLRPVRITRHYTMHAEGSVLIEFGNTKVLCTASVEELSLIHI